MRTNLKNNSEVAHFWANKRQPNGKSGNMFFENETIYSYGYHFPMAKFINKNTVLYNVDSYSITTSQHQSTVRSAIPSYYKVIKCIAINKYDLNSHDHLKNINWYISQTKEFISKSKRARVNKAYYLQDAKNMIYNLNEYLKLFRIKSKLPYKQQKEIKTLLNSDFSQIQDEIIALEKKKQEKERALLAEKLPKWRKGEIYNLPNTNRQFLRVINENIETSLHVKISIDNFKKYYRLLKSGFNMVNIKIDGWRVTNQTDKLLKIGCHTLSINEIEKIYNKIAN